MANASVRTEKGSGGLSPRVVVAIVLTLLAFVVAGWGIYQYMGLGPTPSKDLEAQKRLDEFRADPANAPPTPPPQAVDVPKQTRHSPVPVK